MRYLSLLLLLLLHKGRGYVACVCSKLIALIASIVGLWSFQCLVLCSSPFVNQIFKCRIQL